MKSKAKGGDSRTLLCSDFLVYHFILLYCSDDMLLLSHLLFLSRYHSYSLIVSFGSFHLIRLFFDEFLLYLAEQVAEKVGLKSG